MAVQRTQNTLCIILIVMLVHTKASKSLVVHKDENTKQLELEDNRDLLKKWAKIAILQLNVGSTLLAAEVMQTPLRRITELGLLYTTFEYLHPMSRAFLLHNVRFLNKTVFSQRPVLLAVFVFIPYIVVIAAILTYRVEYYITLFYFDILYVLLFTYFELSLFIVSLSGMLINIYTMNLWLNLINRFRTYGLETAKKTKKGKKKKYK